MTGVAFRRLRIGGLNADSLRQSINITVLNIFLPALCIKIIYTSKIDIEMLLVPATAWITIISTLLISFSVYKFLGRKMHIKPSEKGVLILSAAFGNVSYLGLPVLTGLYGYEAAKYALFYDLLASTPLLWLVGAPMASRYGENKKLQIRESLKTIISLPPIWGIFAGIVLNVTNTPLPAFVQKALGMFGDLVVPLMIFSIGLALTLPKVKHAYTIIPAVVIKLAMVPFISFITAYFLGLKGNALASCLIEGAMPTMVLSLLIAARFKLDASMSAFIIVVTTFLSFITLPVAIYMTKFLIH
ncbi:MAG: AEC family transporter [Thermodesulfovibrionales bacterium]